MKILFAGNPEITLECLEALHKSKYGLHGLLCKPDVKVGRKQILTATPTKQWAIANGVKFFEAEKLNEEFISILNKEKFDIMVCFAFGKIFRESFLKLFPMGAINIHPSLLPKWRGPSPIATAIFNGDTETGITIQTMSLEMDAGDIIIQKKIALSGTETTTQLSKTVAELSASLLLEALNKIEQKEIFSTQNHADATFCHMLNKTHGQLDFMNSAIILDRQIRAFADNIGCYAMWQDNQIFIHEAKISFRKDIAGEVGKVLCYDKNEGILVQTSDGILALTKLQLTGKKILPYNDFINGAKALIGSTLTKGV